MTAPAPSRRADPQGVSPQSFAAGTDDALLDGALTVSPAVNLAELGRTGLRRASGLVLEEFHPKLSHDKALQVYEEMTANSPVIGAMLFAIKALARQVQWYCEATDENDQKAVEQAEFVDECLGDMSVSWTDTLSEILSMLAYGWSYHEIVYKRRQGPQRPGSKQPTSQYDDGKIGWRKLPIRAQNTRHRWLFDEQGGIQGMVQLAPPDYKLVTIPIEKALLFRPELAKGNPEGRSLLRVAYRPWYFGKRMEEIEAIGVERDLAGLPVLEAPAEIFGDGAGAPQQATKAELAKMITGIRRGEQEGVLLPQSYDGEGNPAYKLSLLSTGGERQIDMSKVLERYDLRILQTVMADFIMLGHEKVGSYALSSDKTNLFSVALGAVLDSICEVMNRHAIPRLLELNGMDHERCPKLCHGDIETPDPQVVGDFVQKLSAAGMAFFPDRKSENILRHYIGLPELSEEEYEQREAALQQQRDAEMAAMQSEQNATDVSSEATMMEAEARQTEADAKMIAAKKPVPAAKRENPTPTEILLAHLAKQAPPSTQVVLPESISIPPMPTPTVTVQAPEVHVPPVDVDAIAGAVAKALNPAFDTLAQALREVKKPRKHVVKRDEAGRLLSVEER